MAGFMAGFGPAFSRSFEGARDRAAAERQDTFRLVYDDLKTRRETREAEKKADALAVRKAKALAETAGKPEAWPKAYEWVKGDVAEDTILESIQSGTFEEAVKKADQPDTPAAPSAVDTQMADSGMAPAPMSAPQAAPPAPSGEVDTGNPITNFLKKKSGSVGDFRRDQAIEKIAKSTGADPADVRAELDGTTPVTPSVDSSSIKYTPGAMVREPSKFDTITEAKVEADAARKAYEADPSPENTRRLENADLTLKSVISAIDMEEAIKAKRTGKGSSLHRIVGPNGYELHANIYEDAEGKFRLDAKTGKKEYLGEDQEAIPLDDQEWKLIESATSELTKPRQELSQRKASVEATFGTVHRMDDIVAKNPKVLAKLPAGAVGWLDRTIFGADVASELIRGAVSGESTANQFAGNEPIDKGTIDSTLSELNSLNEKLLTQDMSNLAVQSALYKTQEAIFTYQLASAMGQDGKSLAEPERKLFAQLASIGTSPDKFRAAMGGIMNNMVDTVDAQTRQLPSASGSLDLYTQNYGSPPAGMIPLEMSKELDNTSDPDIKAVWSWVRPTEAPTAPDPTAGLTPANAPKPQAPPAAPEVGTRKTFRGVEYEFQGGENIQENWKAVQ